MNLDFQLGEIINVDSQNNIVYVRSFDSGGNIPVKLDSSLSLQVMPNVGDLVLFVRYGSQITKIIRIWENSKDILRSGNGRLLPGEVQYQSASGSYVYLSADGSISLVDGSMRNIFKMIRKTFQTIIESTEIIFRTFNGLTITHKSDGGYEIIKKDVNTNVTNAQITIDKDGNISVNSNKNVNIIGSTINFQNNGKSAARKDDTVEITIQPGQIQTLSGGPNTNQITATGKITSGSNTVNIG